MRKGSYKLLITHPGQNPWEDSSPSGTPQYTPGGRFPNGSAVFVPITNNTVPAPFNGSYYVFNIEEDPTESYNLAESMPHILAELLADYDEYASTAEMDLSWRWGYDHGDPTKGHNPPCSDDGARGLTCDGPFLGSHYCNYGGEFDCFVLRTSSTSIDIGTQTAVSPMDCQSKCAANTDCRWWVLQDKSCKFKKEQGNLTDCEDCTFGPDICPY